MNHNWNPASKVAGIIPHNGDCRHNHSNTFGDLCISYVSIILPDHAINMLKTSVRKSLFLLYRCEYTVRNEIKTLFGKYALRNPCFSITCGQFSETAFRPHFNGAAIDCCGDAILGTSCASRQLQEHQVLTPNWNARHRKPAASIITLCSRAEEAQPSLLSRLAIITCSCRRCELLSITCSFTDLKLNSREECQA